MRLLVVEDDAIIADFLCRALREQGHVVDLADNGRDGLFLATGEPYDAIVLDRMLPQMDGLTVLSALRATGSRVPVLILSALDHVDERIKGLRAGGDDYLVKPFAIEEVVARLEVITRRVPGIETGNELRVGNLVLDRLARIVRRGEQVISLKPQEFRVLEYLMRHAGQVVTRTMLLENVWDYQFDPQTNVIDVHISRLRSKVDPEGMPALIHTIRGAGYTVREPL
ncbi:response regulator transcription factor [Perlucidibaca piscinae]|uniref:response regulator transcription factor n=1 Tax=Perlucidibaca piscinae TaxID=392589 RepID=UPI0003B2EB06|nr:response regulator transcription factor [Perlucidibaca piscinae]